MSSALNHIAFIPDGNRRWAKQKGVTSLEGHQAGYERFKEVAKWCLDRNIREISFWGFSTENWKRSEEEVGYLMDLFLRMLTKDLQAFAKHGFRLQVVGRREDLSEKVRRAIEEAEDATKDHSEGKLNLCFNYGGRPELLQAAKACLQEGMDPEDLTEELFEKHLWSAQMQDIDLIVRTSGEQRLSGFQPWKGNYAELFFIERHWPDMTEEDLDAAIAFYRTGERRFGGDSGTA